MPSRPKEVERLDFLVGQVHALTSFALALAGVHHERALLRQHFEKSSQVALAKIEMLPVSDKMIVGFQKSVEQILSMLSDQQE